MKVRCALPNCNISWQTCSQKWNKWCTNKKHRSQSYHLLEKGSRSHKVHVHEQVQYSLHAPLSKNSTCSKKCRILQEYVMFTSESTANKWHAVVPYSSLFEKLGAFRKHIISSDQRSKNAVYQYAMRCVLLHSFQKFKILCEGAASTLRAYVYNAAFLQRGICTLFRTYSSIIMRSIPLVQCTYTHIRKKEREIYIITYIHM